MTTSSLSAEMVERWLEAASVRRSRRSYDGSGVAEPALARLNELSETFRPYPFARVAVIETAPADIFSGIVGAYGRISGAPSAVAFLGKAGHTGVEAAVGYTGQALVLEAAALGLATCWVGGLFKARRVAGIAGVDAGEKVFAVSPLGIAAERITGTERLVYRMRPGDKPRKPAAQIAPGSHAWPRWAQAGLEAARLAPSAMHRQPWRFALDGEVVTVSFAGPDTYRVSKRLDCGIAMLHFELGARGEGVDGRWELLDGGADVARYVTK